MYRVQRAECSSGSPKQRGAEGGRGRGRGRGLEGWVMFLLHNKLQKSLVELHAVLLRGRPLPHRAHPREMCRFSPPQIGILACAGYGKIEKFSFFALFTSKSRPVFLVDRKKPLGDRTRLMGGFAIPSIFLFALLFAVATNKKLSFWRYGLFFLQATFSVLPLRVVTYPR
jgi:hypothetical protein